LGWIRREILIPALAEPEVPDEESRTAMPDATIHTHGRVLEILGPVLYRVSLPNGKVILAHLSKALSDQKAQFAVADELRLELTPYDFDNARILAKVGVE
jgi:translation initiation factor IF-1